jgi:uncharacterized delta-60 repeat protein
MKKILVLMLALLALSAPSEAAAQGSLDSSFGDGGKVVRPVAVPGAWDAASPRLAKLPGGGAVVLLGRRLFAFAGDGSPRRRFGGGVVTVAAAPGDSLANAQVVVDAKGRVVVGGTASRGAPGAEDTDLFLARYLPDGSPDPSFGTAGVLLTDLGLPPPELEPGHGSLPLPADRGTAKTRFAGIVAQSDGRLVLGATRVAAIAFCKAAFFPYDEGLAVRLLEDGELDPGFGQEGLARIPELENPSPTLAPSGDVYLWGEGRSLCAPALGSGLMRLDRDGNRDSGFAFGGFLGIPETVLPPGASIAVGRAGEVLLAGSRYRPKTETSRGHMVAVVRRVLPSGHWDRRFGGDGTARLSSIHNHSFVPSDVAVADNGSVVLAGTSWPVRSGSYPRSFMVGRLLADGAVDDRFGTGGRARWRFGGRSQAQASDLALVGAGRLLVVGTARVPSLKNGAGLVLARYLAP